MRTGEVALAALRDLTRYDWLDTSTGSCLHYADLTDDQLVDLEEDGVVGDYIRLACGKYVRGVRIPGVFSRMDVGRCFRCCRATGLPQGFGSPKNSPECRAILGLKETP